MKKLIFTLFLIVTIGGSLFSKSVDPQTAQNVATHFLQSNISALNTISAVDLTLVYTENMIQPDAISPAYYIFNVNKNSGFIIISGDDNVSPILGYSDQSGFDQANLPYAFQKLLELYKTQILFVIDRNIPATEEIEAQWTDLSGKQKSPVMAMLSVNPLLLTKWGQSPNYNALCPYDNSHSERTVTGCVATAMAQVMKFWSFPASGSGIHSYNHDDYGTLTANFGGTTYSWSSMPNSVTSSNTAVATLMYQCGVSVDMDYGVASTGGSGAFVISARSPVTNCAEYAMKTYFNYKPTLQGLEKADYTQTEWINMLKADLDKGHPVIYSGFGSKGGHCFVCDGYDNNSFFHFNWGWSGSNDGYFSVSSLNPSTYDFTNNQQALIGIEPNTGSGTGSSIELNASVTVTPDPIAFSAPYTVHTDFINKGTSNFSGDYCAALYNSNMVFVDYVQIISTGASPLPPNYHYTSGLDFIDTIRTVPGSYFIAIYYRPTGGEWKLAGGTTYTNPISIQIEGPINPVSLNLKTDITPNPTTFIKGQSAQVTANVVNNGTASYTGQYQAALLDITGKYIVETISIISETTGLPAGYTYKNPLSFTTTSITSEPGTYMLALLEKETAYPYWRYVGATSLYDNPVFINVVEGSLAADPYETNNTEGTAFNLVLSYSGNTALKVTTGSNIHVGNDYDYYKISLPSGYSYNITARVHDMYNSGNGNTYSADVLWAYNTGSGWSGTIDDVMSGNIFLSDGGTVNFYVAPYYTGKTGTYLFDLTVTRSSGSFITIDAPVFGEEWKKNTVQNILWSDNISENVIIELFKGTTQVSTLSGSYPSSGTFSWTVPNTLTADNDYRIKITSETTSTLLDYSPFFKITEGPYITVTAPNGTDQWKKGNSYNITWTDNISENVIIELFKGTSQLMTINPSALSNGTQNWTVPNTLTASNDYRIKVTSTTDNSLFGYSSMFNVTEVNSIIEPLPLLVKTYPNPVVNELNLDLGRSDFSNAGYRIFNSLGKEMQSDIINPGQKDVKIDVMKIPPGLYYLDLLLDGKSLYQPFMISR